jgi:N-acetylmuramoyl-L-alanine amidase
VVEIPDGVFKTDLASLLVQNGYVQQVRLNDLKSGKIQIVLDLHRLLDYSVFTLDDPHRIVVDVKHAGPPAPGASPVNGNKEADSKQGVTLVPAGEPTTPVVAVRTPRTGPWIVAIDAGHGGEDPGATYHGTQEKDITLDLAREVTRALEERTGVKPILVRKGDYFIPLRKRWDLAEEAKADLFVSLHCNANEDQRARGTEVYFLSLKGATDSRARELAERENEVDRRLGVAPETSVLDEIVEDMIQADVLMKSERLASECVNRLVVLGTVYERGVKQAGFEVLKSPRMPSILVEAAFISNKPENKLLRDEKWQKRFAGMLADGIDDYLKDIDRAE